MDSLTDTEEMDVFVDLDAVVLVRRDDTAAVGIDAKDEYIEKPVDPPIRRPSRRTGTRTSRRAGRPKGDSARRTVRGTRREYSSNPAR